MVNEGAADENHVVGRQLCERLRAVTYEFVDAERARALGVTPRHVAETVGLVFRGRNLARYRESDRELEMMVSLPEDLQPGLAALEDLPIPRDEGEDVPLGSVARIEVARTQPGIDRENRTVTAWVSR